jgi:hypothetical protein
MALIRAFSDSVSLPWTSSFFPANCTLFQKNQIEYWNFLL